MRATLPKTPALRLALLADAGLAATAGLGLALGAEMLATPLGLPVPLLRGAGLLLLPLAALAAWLGRGETVPRGALRLLVGLNLLWVLDSLLLLLSGFVTPHGLGMAFVLAQAALVLDLALFQWWAGRKAARQPTPVAV